VRHELLIGLDLLRFADEFTQDVAFLPPIELFDPVETAELVFPIPGFSTAGDSSSRVVAPWVVDRIQLGTRLELLAGARLDSISFEDAVQGPAGDRDDTQLNPMGGIVFSPVPDLSLYATAASSFAPPSTTVVGERAPEEGVQVEAGFKLRLPGGRGLLTAAWYRLEKDNIAIPQMGILSQIGDQLSQGVEAELQLQPAEGWFASAVYAYNDAELTRFAERVQVSLDPPAFLELDRSGNAPPYAPRHLFNTWVTRHFDFGLSVGAGARYVGEQFIAEDNAFAISDYWTADAMLGFGRGRFRASLHLRNLTDTEYEARGFPGSAVIPGEPFSVQARIEVGLGER
jgi:outer membrane receptor protein involved in Fe transport